MGKPAVSPDHFSTFGDLLKYLRRREELTQRELAIQVGYSDTQISRLEQNQRVPDAATLTALFVPALHLEREAEWVTRLLELAGQARLGDLPETQAVDKPIPPNNLPVSLTAFIGREKELSQARADLLDDPACRLLTLIGPGGIGKTRLALEVASTVVGAFPDGVFFIPLAPLGSVEHIIPSLAEQIHFRFHESQDLRQQLLDYLRPKKILLILDNFEHLLPGAGLVLQILQAAAGVKILVTSRARLNLTGETVVSLGGLAYPDWEGIPLSHEELSNYEAVKLLIQSARKFIPGFEIQPEDIESVVRVCKLVEGAPLAIMLAANWLEMLSLAEVADEIAQSLDFLESQAQDLPERQRGLRAVFDTTWSMLTGQEQNVLQTLAVFQGPFTRQAAQAVTQHPLAILLSLIHKSWLQRGEDDRYHFHELLRQYTAEKLRAEPARLEEAMGRFSLYYANLLSEQAERMSGPEHESAFVWIAAEFENIRAAWKWLVAKRKFDRLVDHLLPALFRYCEVRAKSFELLEMVELALDVLSSAGEIEVPPQRMAVLLTARASFTRNGEPVRFYQFDILMPGHEDSIRAAWALVGTPQTLGSLGIWGTQLAFVYGRNLDREEGHRNLSHLVQHFREQNRRWELGFALEMLGCMDLVISLFVVDKEAVVQESGESFLKALAIFQQLGDEREAGYTQRWLGLYYYQCHQWMDAEITWKSSQAALHAVGDWNIAVDINRQLGDLQLRLGNSQSAFRYYRLMSQEFLERGHKRVAAYALSKESFETLRYGDIEDARQSREQSLQLSREVQDMFGEAWSTWEMGDIFRVAGDFTVARAWYEQANRLFEKYQEVNGLTFYHRGLGDIALASGNAADALQSFQESLKLAQQNGFKWGAAYALVGMSRASIRLGQYQTAQQDLLEALELTLTTGDSGLASVVMAGYVHLHAALHEMEAAAEVAALILDQHATWNETRRQVIEALSVFSDQPLNHLAVAQGHAHGADLWDRINLMVRKASERKPVEQETC